MSCLVGEDVAGVQWMVPWLVYIVDDSLDVMYDLKVGWDRRIMTRVPFKIVVAIN